MFYFLVITGKNPFPGDVTATLQLQDEPDPKFLKKISFSERSEKTFGPILK